MLCLGKAASRGGWGPSEPPSTAPEIPPSLSKGYIPDLLQTPTAAVLTRRGRGGSGVPHPQTSLLLALLLVSAGIPPPTPQSQTPPAPPDPAPVPPQVLDLARTPLTYPPAPGRDP